MRLRTSYWHNKQNEQARRDTQEGYPLNKPYRYVPPDRVGALRRSGLKTGIHFAHFGLELGMGFGETTGMCERIYRFNSK